MHAVSVEPICRVSCRACADSSCSELLLPLVTPQPLSSGHSDMDADQSQLPLHQQLVAIGLLT